MTQKLWSTLELIRWTSGYFAEHGVPSPRLDAEMLLAFALGVGRIELYTAFDKPVEAAERERFRELVRERAQKRTPVAYLVGLREFWSLEFNVTSAVLIPRPETETLVREALACKPRRIAEIGIGSGAITGALASELPEATIDATEISAEALAVATQNLQRLGVADRCSLQCSDGVAGLVGPYDVIVSNPPYIATRELEGLEPEVRCEPVLALDGGPDGLEMLRRLVSETPALLAPDGALLLEVGIGQSDAVAALMQDAGATQVAQQTDLAGIPRVVRGRFGGSV